MKKLIGSRYFLYLAWLGRILLAGAIIYSIISNSFDELHTIVFFSLLSFLPLFMQKKLPHLYDFLIVLSIVINVGAFIWKTYNTIFFYDEMAHLYTTFAVSFSIPRFISATFGKSAFHNKLLSILVITSFGITLGTLWEVSEWISEFFTKKQIISGLFDTMTDILWDSAGALTAAILHQFVDSRINTAKRVKSSEHKRKQGI